MTSFMEKTLFGSMQSGLVAACHKNRRAGPVQPSLRTPLSNCVCEPVGRALCLGSSLQTPRAESERGNLCRDSGSPVKYFTKKVLRVAPAVETLRVVESKCLKCPSYAGSPRAGSGHTHTAGGLLGPSARHQRTRALQFNAKRCD